jgi:branched-chain amino acid aminotransferase
VIATAITDLLGANGLSDAGVRLTLTRGPGPRGLAPPPETTPTLLIAAFALPPPAQPVRATIAQGTRRNERSPLSRTKALGYLDAILALREANERQADEALLLNTRDRLACATAANLWAVRDGHLFTPPLDDGALPGITRGLLLEIASTLGMGTQEMPFAPQG